MALPASVQHEGRRTFLTMGSPGPDLSSRDPWLGRTVGRVGDPGHPPVAGGVHLTRKMLVNLHGPCLAAHPVVLLREACGLRKVTSECLGRPRAVHVPAGGGWGQAPGRHRCAPNYFESET